MLSLKKNKFAALAILLPLLSTGFVTSCAVKQHPATTVQYTDGSVLANQVQSKIAASPKLKNTAITVKSNKDRVELNGSVHTKKQKKVAGKLAMSVPGVKSVDNDIVVKK